LACGVFAQGRGGRGGAPAGLTSELTLIRRSDVQTDLNLTDDQKSKITDVMDKMRAAFPRRGGGGGGGGGGGQAGPSPEDRAKMMADFTSQVNAILTPDQQTRIKEIAYQVSGNAAVADKDTQSALGLSDDQKAKTEDLVKQEREANTALREKSRSGEIDRSEVGPRMQKNRETLKEQLGAVLTPDQQSKLKSMGGTKPFVATDQPGGGGGR
jgi:hypothetical protein